MRRLQLPAVLFLSCLPASAQTCPAIDFRSASQVSLVAPRQSVSGPVQFGNGDGTFQSPQTIATPGFLVYIAAGDLNMDGKPDIVAVDTGDGVALVVLNAGNGAFPSLSGYLTGTEANQVFLMDFDWDGNTDIVFGAGHPDSLVPAVYDQSVTVLFGNGDGSFNSAPAYPVKAFSGPNIGGLALADFNHDGQTDAVAGSSPGISVLTGHGDGADFNRDGKIDFIATSTSLVAPANISVFLGNGNGTFQPPSSIPVASSGLTGAAVGDFNADGKMDFAVADSHGGTAASVLVYLGNGDGSFGAPTTFQAGSNPVDIQAVDVNGDGKLDLVVTNNGAYASPSDPGGVSVLPGVADGAFQPAIPYTAGFIPLTTQVADINGDGHPDLIATTVLNFSSFTYGLSIRLNQGNGVFGSAQALTSDFSPIEVAAADFRSFHRPHQCPVRPPGVLRHGKPRPRPRRLQLLARRSQQRWTGPPVPGPVPELGI